MEEGINILCADGHRRLCFPRFAAYICDYEEAWRLAGLLKGNCVKCTIQSSRNQSQEEDFDPDIERRNYPLRTSDEAASLRARFGDEKALGDYGYRHIIPFTENCLKTSGCSIHDAVAPDLLHQVSKNFYDQIFKKWLAGVKAEGATDEALKAELDSRFQHTPSYPRLKWFGRGIMHIPRWTGAEYKTMMRVFLGIARGLEVVIF
jgi:hypothetical protein